MSRASTGSVSSVASASSSSASDGSPKRERHFLDQLPSDEGTNWALLKGLVGEPLSPDKFSGLPELVEFSSSPTSERKRRRSVASPESPTDSAIHARITELMGDGSSSSSSSDHIEDSGEQYEHGMGSSSSSSSSSSSNRSSHNGSCSSSSSGGSGGDSNSGNSSRDSSDNVDNESSNNHSNSSGSSSTNHDRTSTDSALFSPISLSEKFDLFASPSSHLNGKLGFSFTPPHSIDDLAIPRSAGGAERSWRSRVRDSPLSPLCEAVEQEERRRRRVCLSLQKSP